MRTIICLLLGCLSGQGALFFEGNDDQLVRFDQNVEYGLSWNARLTLALWINRSVTNSCSLCSDSDDQGQLNNAAHLGWQLAFDNSMTNRMDFAYRRDADQQLQRWSSGPNAGSTTNQWMHIAFVISNAGPYVAFYINGVLQTGGSWTAGTGTDVAYIGDGCEIGGFHNSQFFAGQIADFSLWSNRTLTSMEVFNLARSRVKRISLQIQPSSVIYLPLDQFHIDQNGEGTNNFINLSTRISASGIRRLIGFTGESGGNAPPSTGEQVQSYPPNE